MTKNKFLVLLLAIVSFLGGIFLVSFSPGVQTFAQRLIKSNAQINNNYEYCAITRVWVENPTQDNVIKFIGRVEIVYFSYSYDRITVTESWEKKDSITDEINYQKFLQDNGLRPSAAAQESASSRAADMALAKALTKLGREGWEIEGRSFSNVDFLTINRNSEYKNSLFLRRIVGQQQSINQQ